MSNSDNYIHTYTLYLINIFTCSYNYYRCKKIVHISMYVFQIIFLIKYLIIIHFYPRNALVKFHTKTNETILYKLSVSQYCFFYQYVTPTIEK